VNKVSVVTVSCDQNILQMVSCNEECCELVSTVNRLKVIEIIFPVPLQ